MLRYEPINGSHAIQEAVFYVQFVPEIDVASFRQISAQSGDLTAILPAKSDMLRIRVETQEVGNQSFSQTIAGIEFRSAESDSVSGWLMRFTADGVSVHCTAYTRYDEVWSFARNLILKAVALVPAGHAVGAIGMRYVDRFRYNDEHGSYDLKFLFRENNRYITPRCFEAGNRWHCHNGWFALLRDTPSEMSVEQDECLNQLNLASAHEVSPAATQTFVTVDHNLVVRPSQPGGFHISQERGDQLDGMMMALHRDNKRTMAQLLTEDICRRLNLVVDEMDGS